MFSYLIVGLSWLFICTKAIALTISPLVIELNTDHKLTSQIIVTNNSTETLALEANIHLLDFLPDGTIRTSNSLAKNILIFPPAILLKPGKNQTFRVQWISKDPLEKSQSYFIRFSTANIRKGNKKSNYSESGINIKIHYNALLHVYASILQPKIKMEIGEKGNLTLTNLGNRFTFTTAINFKNIDNKFKKTLTQVLGERFLPPNSNIKLSSSINNLPAGTYYGYEQ